MAELMGIAEIAKRLGVDLTTVRRLIARETDDLKLTLHRGKGATSTSCPRMTQTGLSRATRHAEALYRV